LSFCFFKRWNICNSSWKKNEKKKNRTLNFSYSRYKMHEHAVFGAVASLYVPVHSCWRVSFMVK
jgi:hypothetical protein